MKILLLVALMLGIVVAAVELTDGIERTDKVPAVGI